mmetsp:Transcript_60417/g.160954  ORF Transcript_60417/g.160954 Transcript_60417/m.160954 type:complete len:155 (-) Transcript_60417:382-846(-)|eukprot:CAMPEP_0113673688 /NCGR_PEP_ID=MMETSP0038_2-20120614/6996_1 /TAXON_ID=2898 /ORGANISM="Cryptomonas paramecium" /LENGTH=154 /DNA_ID=CAMNT_0000590173 /DNA_START=235 /DNA_END=699 /DNA_ORIENTATION=+ /assembly_acc=CAM_ASM_000170
MGSVAPSQTKHEAISVFVVFHDCIWSVSLLHFRLFPHFASDQQAPLGADAVPWSTPSTCASRPVGLYDFTSFVASAARICLLARQASSDYSPLLGGPRMAMSATNPWPPRFTFRSLSELPDDLFSFFMVVAPGQRAANVRGGGRARPAQTKAAL